MVTECRDRSARVGLGEVARAQIQVVVVDDLEDLQRRMEFVLPDGAELLLGPAIRVGGLAGVA